jgi:hypothetical protein
MTLFIDFIVHLKTVIKMDYKMVVKKVFQFFKEEGRETITMKQISNIIGVETTIASRKYVNKMITEGLLSVGKSHFIRNDNVYRMLHGYEVGIIKEFEDGRIFLDEWIGYLDGDNELRHDGYAELTNPLGEHSRLENKGLSLWTEHPDNLTVWFDYCDGKIIVKNPDQEARIKMFKIAKYFGAIVKGQDGEFYGENGLMLHL